MLTLLCYNPMPGEGIPYRAYVKAVTHPNHGIVCDQNIDELRRVYNRKFPHKIQALERFLALALTVLEVVPVPAADISDEALVRDQIGRSSGLPLRQSRHNCNR